MRAATPGRGRSEDERQYYALNARVYRWLSRCYDLLVFSLGRLRRQAVRAADLGDGARVLDVATGTGAQGFAFAGRAAEVVGVDLSPAMLRVARRKKAKDGFANVTFVEADATELPFPDASFDAACISFALHEMPMSVRERALGEMTRVTRPGGTIVVVDYALPGNAAGRWLAYHFVKLYERDHYPDFVRSDLHALLRGAGLELRSDRKALSGVARIVTASKPAA